MSELSFCFLTSIISSGGSSQNHGRVFVFPLGLPSASACDVNSPLSRPRGKAVIPISLRISAVFWFLSSYVAGFWTASLTISPERSSQISTSHPPMIKLDTHRVFPPRSFFSSASLLRLLLPRIFRWHHLP